MIIYLPLLVTIIGLLIYGITQGKPAEAGRLTFAIGLLVTCLQLAGKAVRL